MKLKTTIGITLLLAFSFLLTNCRTTVHTHNVTTKSKKIPPGQAKKTTGAKSAKAYTPGHNKS